MRLIFTFRNFIFLYFLLFFVLKGYSQTYTITGNVNASSYTCNSFVGYTTISIGNGSATTKLTMDQDLDLIGSCTLGPIRIIINNATIDFSTANKRLTLPEGSSIEFTNGGTLYPNGGTGGGCTGSDRIYIGTKNIAACQGSSGVVGFDDINAMGGTGTAYSNSPVCVGNSINLSATPPPNGTFAYVWSGPNSYTSNLQNPTLVATASNGGVYNVTMTRTDGKVAYAQVTVTVNATATVGAISGGATTVCVNSSTPAFTNSTSGGSWSITNGTGSAGITTGGVVTGLTEGTVTVVYTVTNGSCSTTATKGLTVSSNNTVGVASSSPTLCVNTMMANITHSTTGATGIGTATGLPTGVSAAWASNTITISGTPSVSGTFNYSIPLTGGCGSVNATGTITVNTNSVAPTAISGATTICSGNSTTLTLSGGTVGTGAVAKWYSGSCGGTLVGTGNSISVSPTSTTTYYVRYEGTCNSTACASTTVTVNPLPAAAGSISGVASVCKGTSSVSYSISTIANATSYMWSYSGTGATISGVTNSVTIAFASNATSGNLIVYGSNSCGNGTVSTAFAITVNDLPSTPTAGTPTNPNCKVPTGSVPLSGLPSSGTIIQTGDRNDTYTITGGGTQTISGLLPGNYNFAVSNGSCTSATVNVVILAPVTNTWSTGSWSDGTPTINQRLVFASDYTNANDVDIVGCSCQVAGTSAVTIKSGRTMKIENGIEVMPGASLTFENNASLVQINDDAENSGNINYKRSTAPVKRYDFTYWSSPVDGQTLKNLSPDTLYDKYYGYNNGWQIYYNGAATMVSGRGYLIRAPQTFSITVAAVDSNPVFIGKPNNGVVSFSITENQVHLLGNPYPSAIDADAFLNTNSAALEGTLYFWTHNSPPSREVSGDETYAYTTNDYATYNRTGGTETAPAKVDLDPNDPNDNNNLVTPSGMIAAGQGFFAPASAAGGILTFNNSMRVEGGTSGVNNSQFFKLTTSAKTSTISNKKNRIWLNLSNKAGAFKQALVGYIPGATNNYEGAFDGLTYDGNQFVDFYSVNQTKKYTIQGRALPFVKQDTIVLGYKSNIVGEFQISIDHADGVLAAQNVFLEDKNLQVLHDLKKEPYTFTTEKGVFDNRFVLRYVNKNAVDEVVVGPGTTEEVNKDVLVSVKEKEITISSLVELLESVVVYDVSGKIIYQKDAIAANVFVIPNLISSRQVLVVDILLTNNVRISRKIVY